MRPVHHSLALAAAAVLTVTGSVAAQQKPAGILNSLEVRQLVERAEPGDHVRLSAHFITLGERYAAEAERHISMSQSFVGNPSRNLGAGMSVHCKRLANLNTQSATTVRELAAYHDKLSTGTPATPARDGAPFHGGAGAPEATEKELNALAAKANTPREHRALGEYFVTLTRRYTAEANEHATLAQTYRGTRIAQTAVIHDRFADLARDSAKEATAAADMHKALATVAR
jgi:hypothetical protein